MRDELLSISEAARESGTSRQAIHDAINRGALEAVESGSYRFVLRRSLRSYKPDPKKIKAGKTGARKTRQAQRRRAA
jgi:hypothetical protein